MRRTDVPEASHSLVEFAVLPRYRSWLGISIPATMAALVIFACFLGPLLLPIPEPVGGSPLDAYQPVLAPGHLLGTDHNGNDTLSRLMHGGRASLRIAVLANAIGLVLGSLLGCFSGYVGGYIDSVIMRILDVLIAFPSIVLVIVMAQTLGPSQTNTVIALMSYSVPAFARISRVATLRLRTQPFMTVALLSGTGALSTLLRHVAPNVLPQLIAFASLGMGIVIVLEGALSFLGLGVPTPNPSWGNMIFQGSQTIWSKPDLVILPSALLFITALSFNLVGENLQERWARG